MPSIRDFRKDKVYFQRAVTSLEEYVWSGKSTADDRELLDQCRLRVRNLRLKIESLVPDEDPFVREVEERIAEICFDIDYFAEKLWVTEEAEASQRVIETLKKLRDAVEALEKRKAHLENINRRPWTDRLDELV